MLSTLCRLANRVPGVYVGRMPLVPIDEVRWFDRSAEYELRLWSVTVEIKTGQRRIIEYLLSPLLKSVKESLRER